MSDFMSAYFAGKDRRYQENQRAQQEAQQSALKQYLIPAVEGNAEAMAALGQASPEAYFEAQKMRTQQQSQQQSQQEQQLKGLAAMVGYLDRLPPDQRALAFPSIRQKAIQAGIATEELPQQWTPELEQALIPLKAQLAQYMQGDGAAGVQSTYTDAQGNRVAVMRDGTTRLLGQSDLGMDSQSIETVGADGRTRRMTFNKRTGQYEEPNIGGGQPQMAPQPQAAPGAVNWGGSTGFEISPEDQQALASLPPADQEAALRAMRGQPSKVENGRVSPFVSRTPEEQAALTERAKGTAQADVERQTVARTNSAAFESYKQAMNSLGVAMDNTSTGPLMGKLPAYTAEQQIADGAIAALAPILKGLFRTSGEGTFTDKDQELLMAMIPTRTDRQEARKAKIANMNAIVAAKLNAQGVATPAKPEASGWSIQKVQ